MSTNKLFLLVSDSLWTVKYDANATVLERHERDDEVLHVPRRTQSAGSQRSFVLRNFACVLRADVDSFEIRGGA